MDAMQHVGVIEQRLSHAHVYDVVEPFAMMLQRQFIDEPNLVENLGGREIAHAFEVSRCTKFAIKGTAHLGTNASGGPRTCGGQNAFHFVAIEQLKGHFDGAIFGVLGGMYFGYVKRKGLGEFFTQGFGEIGHLFETARAFLP